MKIIWSIWYHRDWERMSNNVLLLPLINSKDFHCLIIRKFSIKCQPEKPKPKLRHRSVAVITTAQLLHCTSCSPSVGDSRWRGSLTMVPAGNKAKRLSSVNHTTKTIHHHHHHHHTVQIFTSNSHRQKHESKVSKLCKGCFLPSSSTHQYHPWQ